MKFGISKSLYSLCHFSCRQWEITTL